MSSRERGGKLENCGPDLEQTLAEQDSLRHPHIRFYLKNMNTAQAYWSFIIQCNRYTPQQSKSKQFQFAILCPTDTTFQTPRDFFCFSFFFLLLSSPNGYIYNLSMLQPFLPITRRYETTKTMSTFSCVFSFIHSVLVA
jgi:hypothetical protein